jgi:hypothetical protein
MTLRLQSPANDLFAQRGVNEKSLNVELVVALHERILINAIRDGHAIQHLEHQILTQALCPATMRRPGGQKFGHRLQQIGLFSPTSTTISTKAQV